MQDSFASGAGRDREIEVAQDALRQFVRPAADEQSGGAAERERVERRAEGLAAIARAASATEAASEITTHPGVMKSATFRSRRAPEALAGPGWVAPDSAFGDSS
jgi:hypothetical protein